MAIQDSWPHSTTPPGSWICAGEPVAVTVAWAVTVRVAIVSGIGVGVWGGVIGVWVGWGAAFE
ncbi:hypothetical protein HMPREF9622_00652 [Cutibacterium modestum HL037PA3]|nr:hypothetical protein HMPREF9621_01058 [Cutibacterium modestum HL037PA2]EFT16443.1 hypothetical protein HMPREF9622_00652 [Cutibacterium modestum HL037PA3]